MKIIKVLRKRTGLTQTELAKRLDVSYQAVAGWENGKSQPSADKLPKIAEIFKCSIDDLFK